MKAVVLLSSGLDSTVNLYMAARQMQKPVFDQLLALQFDYGQKAFAKENLQAAKICNQLNLPFKTVKLPFIADWNVSSLINQNQSIPQGESVQINDPVVSGATAKSVWVPNRNGIFLNIAAGFAEALNYQYVIPGFNIEEAQTFADNSMGFIQELEKCFSYSTNNQVKVHCYTIDKNKTQIVQMGQKLGVDFKNIWPCYQSLDKWCGVCESCKRAKRAFAENQIDMGDFFAV
jgi:7-cyano-7-deazaguanine synthase